jgi:hypothetical protein
MTTLEFSIEQDGVFFRLMESDSPEPVFVGSKGACVNRAEELLGLEWVDTDYPLRGEEREPADCPWCGGTSCLCAENIRRARAAGLDIHPLSVKPIGVEHGRWWRGSCPPAEGEYYSANWIGDRLVGSVAVRVTRHPTEPNVGLFDIVESSGHAASLGLPLQAARKAWKE